jgi:hypothetical protein
LISFLFTIVWLVGITNAFNLIDGLDGLASGAALFSSLVILGVSVSQDRPLMMVFSLVLCGSVAGFLRYNFNPASIFLGDSGALFIGFLLAAMSVLGTQKATTAVAIFVPILAFGFPVVDTAMTMGRRLVSRKPVFQGDNEHIHHMLLARGWSQRRVAIVLYGVCAMFGLLALMFPATGSKLTGFMLFVISVAVIVAVGHLRYHEVEEIRAGVKRNLGAARRWHCRKLQICTRCLRQCETCSTRVSLRRRTRRWARQVARRSMNARLTRACNVIRNRRWRFARDVCPGRGPKKVLMTMWRIARRWSGRFGCRW